MYIHKSCLVVVLAVVLAVLLVLKLVLVLVFYAECSVKLLRVIYYKY